MPPVAPRSPSVPTRLCAALGAALLLLPAAGLAHPDGHGDGADHAPPPLAEAPLRVQAAPLAQRRPSHCIALAGLTPGIEYVHRASPDAAQVELVSRDGGAFGEASFGGVSFDWASRHAASVVEATFLDPVAPFSVRISYIDHSMFLLQTPGGLSAVTDYNGFVGPTRFIPDVVTMNRAHSTHWTANPDPAIPHVLPGWNTEGPGPVDHYVDLGEMVVRNVSTNIRGGFGASPEVGGNSIFVFEVEGLCIGHLGHLHHVPTDAQFAALGRLDVVMAPVDGGLTMTLAEMTETLKRLRSSIVLPMHWFSGFSLNEFLAGMQDEFRIELREGREIEVSLRDLPSEPTIIVLRPRFLGFNDGTGGEAPAVD